MACEFGYRLTGKAEADLDNILSYMAVQLANSQVTVAFLEKLQAAISEAYLFPESDLPVDNAFLPCKIIRKKQVGNYILYYFNSSADLYPYIDMYFIAFCVLDMVDK